MTSFAFAGKRQAVSEADKRDHFSRFNIPEDRLAAMVSRLPDRMANYNRIQVIAGNLYLLRSENLGHALTGQLVDVYSPEGKHIYHGKIQVEEGWQLTGSDNLQLTDGFVYAILENSEGNIKIVKYAITLPS